MRDIEECQRELRKITSSYEDSIEEAAKALVARAVATGDAELAICAAAFSMKVLSAQLGATIGVLRGYEKLCILPDTDHFVSEQIADGRRILEHTMAIMKELAE